MDASVSRRRGWLLLAFGVVTAMTLRRVLPDGTDLSSYLAAAREMTDGGADLYRPRQEVEAYPYPHVFLLPLAALDSLLPETVVRTLWAAGLGIAAAWLLAGLDRLGRCTAAAPRWWRWLLLLLLFGRTITSNTTNAQLSLWIGALVVHGLLGLVEERPGRAGLALGTAAALKLTPLLFLVALPLMGRWRATATMAGTVLGLVLVVPWPVLGTQEHVRHLGDFHRAMIAPAVLGDATSTAFELGPSASVRGTLGYLLQDRVRDDAGRRFFLADLDDTTLRWIVIAWSTVLGSLCVAGFLRARRAATPRRLALQGALVMLAAALLSPLSRTYHLVGILWPAWILCREGPRGRDPLWWTTAAAWALATTLRQKDLLGRELWWHLEHTGLPHLALVGLLAWVALRAPVPGARGRPPDDPTEGPP